MMKKSRYNETQIITILKAVEAGRLVKEENRHLKQMYANLSLEHTILKDIIEKKL
jgi:putative transposase